MTFTKVDLKILFVVQSSKDCQFTEWLFFSSAVTLKYQIIFIHICIPMRAIENHLHYDKCAIYSLFLFFEHLESNINSDYR